MTPLDEPQELPLSSQAKARIRTELAAITRSHRRPLWQPVATAAAVVAIAATGAIVAGTHHRGSRTPGAGSAATASPSTVTGRAATTTTATANSTRCPAPADGGHLVVDLTKTTSGNIAIRLGTTLVVPTSQLLHAGDAVIGNALAPATTNGMGANEVFSSPQAGPAELIELHDGTPVATVHFTVVDC